MAGTISIRDIELFSLRIEEMEREIEALKRAIGSIEVHNKWVVEVLEVRSSATLSVIRTLEEMCKNTQRKVEALERSYLDFSRANEIMQVHIGRIFERLERIERFLIKGGSSDLLPAPAHWRP